MACTICDGRLFKVDKATGNAVPCECQVQLLKKEIKSKVMNITRIPPVFWDQTLEGYKEMLPLVQVEASGAFRALDTINQSYNTKSLSKIYSYISDPKTLYDKEDPKAKVVWIYGASPCSGHTSLACLLAKALWQVNARTVFFKMGEIRNHLVDFDSTVMKPQQFEDKLIDNYDAYIIDDIYNGNKLFSSDSEYLLSAFSNLIERIVYQNKLIICTADSSIRNITSELYKNTLSVLVPYVELLPVVGTLQSKYY